MFNANEWFNNKLNVQKPKYRYQNPGGTIGGPLIIPGTNFNKSRRSCSSSSRTTSCATATPSTTPSPCLRRWNGGRFLADRDHDRARWFRSSIRPRRAPFPGNKIPANRISPQGQAMLNLFPLPDPQGLALDPTRKRAATTSALSCRSSGRSTTRSCAWTTTSRPKTA